MMNCLLPMQQRIHQLQELGFAIFYGRHNHLHQICMLLLLLLNLHQSSLETLCFCIRTIWMDVLCL